MANVIRMAEHGDRPAFKAGDASRIRHEVIDAWIERRQRERGGDSSAKLPGTKR